MRWWGHTFSGEEQCGGAGCVNKCTAFYLNIQSSTVWMTKWSTHMKLFKHTRCSVLQIKLQHRQLFSRQALWGGRRRKEREDKEKADWEESIEGQSRATYTGAAQSLRGAKAEREGKTEGQKIEKEERQHTVRPSKEKNDRNSWDRLCKSGERSGQRGLTDEKTAETDKTADSSTHRLLSAALHHNSHGSSWFYTLYRQIYTAICSQFTVLTAWNAH